MLRIRAGREGDEGSAHGDIEFTNVGSRPCVLGGLPQAAIVQADGKPLPVRLVRAPNLSLSLAVLAPGTLNAADLVVFWANWCGRPPGPLSVRITLPAAGGVVTGPFNGPPDYNFVPECFSRGQPSTISVIDAYGPGLASGSQCCPSQPIPKLTVLGSSPVLLIGAGSLPWLSRPGARCRDCSWPVSPGRSPNPACCRVGRRRGAS